ncbi:MAG: hypothetical protein KGR71_03765 [Proteobacteria bacterium]|nr:hypothetical protein [Pseudomonadota bacterium]
MAAIENHRQHRLELLIQFHGGDQFARQPRHPRVAIARERDRATKK